ncbi:LytR family transcriptional regulator [Lentibacillus cibarius]|uniref:LytR family transcriptional regulator n=1 Tax=Lentibacillus cibarius TaxID=2583219 RepID=A0A549YFL3_9BACI|nr:LCP family protein [Lentibacillus cibarius]TRM10627.1 LytR family transcriptional regulator [Lentibacillus cibarius]
MSKRKKWLIVFGVCMLLVVAGGVGYAMHLYDKTEETVTESQKKISRDHNTSELRVEEVDPVEDNVSVLFIGVDNSEIRNEQTSRSDALILATFNKESSSVKLLSIPRDSYVYVPEVDRYTKITHAHAYGGAEATIETVENFLDVPVDYYAEMNFNGFVDVVDALGGIKYDVPYEFSEFDSNDKRNGVHLNAGYQTLNGEEALALARTRKYDNDIERGKRQQAILKTIFDKATSTASVFKLGEVIDAIGSNMTTNMTFTDMKNFLSYGLDENVAIDKMILDGSGGYMDDGLWYFQVSEDSKRNIRAELRNHLDMREYADSNDRHEKAKNDI